MNPAGIVIAVAGTWILCQIFGGNALVRLGILEGKTMSYGKKLN